MFSNRFALSVILLVMRRGAPILRLQFISLACAGWCCVLLASVALAAPAERVTLEKPVQITFDERDHAHRRGRVTAYDRQGFDLLTAKGRPARIAWSELDARDVYGVRSSLIPPGDASAWLALGRDLRKLEGGEDWSTQALDRAVQIDPSLKDEIDRITGRDAAAPPATQAADSEPSRPAVGSAAPPPPVVAAPRERVWGTLSDSEQAEQIGRLKEIAAAEIAKVGRPLQLRETRYFLFYSDLPAAEAEHWSGLVDRMYGRLAELFGVTRGRNIWRGKGVLFVFADRADYRRFERELRGVEPGESAGMTHCFDDGAVKIVFYRQPEELVFAHVLVHEAVHGFVHRYRTSAAVPSWANEGLAEAIASELAPDPSRAARVTSLARRGLALHKDKLDDFFAAGHIDLWHYAVAETLCQDMIRTNKKAYVDFINGIKDGKPWQQSLESSYQLPLAKLVQGYIESLKPKAGTR